MDEEEVGREQARLLRQVILRAGLRLDDVWMHYFSLGGDAAALEIEAYLHHALAMPQLQRDMLAHAVNELIDQAPTLRAPYSSDIAAVDTQTRVRCDDDSA